MPTVSIKAILIVHWTLFIWAIMQWGNAAYMWCNLTILAVALWAIADRQSVDALFLFIAMMLFSIVEDIVVMSLYHPVHNSSSATKFSFAMAIINLILKPFSLLLIYQMYKDRGGEYNITFGNSTQLYDNIGGETLDDEQRGSSAYVKPPEINVV